MQPDVRNGSEQGIKITFASYVTDIANFDIVLNSYRKHITIVTNVKHFTYLNIEEDRIPKF